MKNLLGCHLSASMKKNGGRTMMEGPIFTAGKLTPNGWGISQITAEKTAKSFIGKPVRYCPRGVDIDGIPGDHACDAANDADSIVGVVEHVYSKKDDQGRDVYYAVASFNGRVPPEILPQAWSIFARASDADENGLYRDVEGISISLTTKPLYDEARTRLIAASGKNSDINTKGVDNMTSTDTNDKPQMDTKTQSQTQENPKMDEKPQIKQEPVATETEPANTPKMYTEEQVKNLLDELVPKIKEQAVKETRLAFEKEALAKSLVSKMMETGAIGENDADAKLQAYMKLPKETLDIIKADLEAVASRIPREQGFDGVEIKKQQPKTTIPRELRDYLTIFGLTEEQYKKTREVYK